MTNAELQQKLYASDFECTSNTCLVKGQQEEQGVPLRYIQLVEGQKSLYDQMETPLL